VLVLMLTTAILGPILTQQFAPRLLEEVNERTGTAAHSGRDDLLK